MKYKRVLKTIIKLLETASLGSQRLSMLSDVKKSVNGREARYS